MIGIVVMRSHHMVECYTSWGEGDAMACPCPWSAVVLL